MKKSKKPDSKSLQFPSQLLENDVILQLRQTVEKLRVFESIGKTLTSSDDLSEVLQTLTEKIGGLVSSPHFALILLNEKLHRGDFEFPQEFKDSKISVPLGQGLLGKALELGEGQRWIRPMQEADFDPKIDAALVCEPTSMMTFPLISKGIVIGLLVFYTQKKQTPFTGSDYRSLECFADYLTIAVDHVRNLKKVRELTIADDLTELYNSRYLQSFLEKELARSERYQEEFSVVFIDLDNFKLVNDRHGHMTGSSALKEFARFLLKIIRNSDVAVRYGGDEFVLVLPKTSKEEALQFVTRALEHLRTQRFACERHIELEIQASFGISSFPEDGRDIQELVTAADKAMYHVKKTGKNGVCIYSPALAPLGMKSLKQR